MTETFYDLLGVAEDAGTDEITDAYRQAVKEVHPDVSDEADASERTKRLNEAKRVLTDESERARYDRLGHEAYANGDPDATETGSSDRSGRSAAGSGNGSARSRSSADGPTETRGSTGPGGATGTGGSAGTGGTTEAGGSESEERSADDSTWRGSSQRARRSAGRRESRRRTTSRDVDGSNERRSSGTSESRAGGGHSANQSRGDATGSDWQTGARGGEQSRSARRQAAAGGADGPNADWSWNAWRGSDAWAVRDEADVRRGLRLSRLFPADQSVVLLASTFLLYPFFVGTVLFPAFPLVARAAVAVCTLLMFAYLLSIPEVAVVVFGLWSALAPLALLAAPGVGFLSIAGVVVVVSTWVPLGLSVLTFSVVRP